MANHDKVLRKVLKKIKPTQEQREKLEELSGKALQIANKEVEKYNAKAILVGSTTRETWLPGKNEFDLFIIFPKKISEEKLEKTGLDLGKKIIKKLHGKWRIEYAQHPYVRGTVKDINMDIVPCYKVKSGERIISAVDRTPFHVEYLNKHLQRELSDEVRLLKQFLKANGVYGADAKTEGFSGYICELLIIKYRSFIGLLKAVIEWRPGEIIDIEGYWDKKDYRKLRRKFKNEVLIIIDPVDKNRNAGAAVSAQNFYIFKKSAKRFLKKPKESCFFAKEVKPLDKGGFHQHRKNRGTDLILVKFKPPKVVPDILWPQLRKATKRIEGILREYEFSVLRSDCWTNEKDLAVVLLEMEVSNLPLINKRVGPLIFDLNDSENFMRKYKKESLVGPFVEGNFWCVEIKRKWKNAAEKLKDSLKESDSILKAKGIPNHIAKQISRGFKILGNEQIEKIMNNEDFSVFLREYFEKESLVSY